MNIAVIGAAGRTGRLVVLEAARRRHYVTALVRNPEHLGGITRVIERVVYGDGADLDSVADVLSGQDAVVVTVSSRGAKVPVGASVAAAVVKASAAAGVTRMIFTSTYGMVATRPLVMAGLLKRVLARPFDEQRRADDIVAASNADWTILRATRLTDHPRTGLVRVGSDPLLTGPFSLTRADLAQQLVDLVEHPIGIRTILNMSGERR